MSAKQSRFWNEKLGFLTINGISFRLSNAHTLGHFLLIKKLWNFKFKLPDFINIWLKPCFILVVFGKIIR